MTDYVLRLAGLSLAVFFLVHLALGLAVRFGAVALVDIAARSSARAAAATALALRLVPFGGAAFAVFALCVPSYLRYEPAVADETIGLACLGIAMLGFAILSVALVRAIRAGRESARLVRGLRTAAGESRVVVMDESAPVLAVVGVFRPRIVISKSVIGRLSRSELAAALRHERAHQSSRDNLKRLLIALSPGILPGWNGFDRLESAWRRFSEWAADDEASAGRAARSLALAAALVRMARIGRPQNPAVLATSLLADDKEFPTRVERLLESPHAVKPWTRGMVLGSVAAAAAVVGIFVLTGAMSLETVHRILENLVG